MVKISEIARTSTFAWSLDTLPILATGTVAGAVDASFNSLLLLELWDIFSATNTNEPIFSAAVEHRFYALAWSKPFEGRPRGLIAAAFENGVIEFWDAEVLIILKDLAKASVHKLSKHSGPVRSLQFNPLQSHVLVSGGSHGQIFIWDTKKFTEPFSPGLAMTPMDEISSVAWNNSVSHILASTGNSGYTSIWDLKSKREVLHLSYTGASGRANFSHVAWHPTKLTELITASDNDACPLILTWDLRNSNAPEKILEGHKKGVLSLDWCQQDPELLISSGKDNTTFLWNPTTGQKLGEYPTTANWAFQTAFAPKVPDIFATASFDGKIVVQSLQDTSPPVSEKVTSNDDNVFWNQLSTTDTQQPVFDIKQAPQWLKTPSAVSFGFGSKLVQVLKDSNGKSIINIQKFVAKGQSSSSELYTALKNNNFKSIIDEKISSNVASDLDKSDWKLLQKLAESGKDEILTEVTTEEEEKKPETEIELEDKKNGDSEDVPASADDSFFDNLGNGKVVLENEAPFVPSGSFKIFSAKVSEEDKSLIKLVLGNKIEDAVHDCIERGKLLEALVLALDASDDIKEKVKNAYFKKNVKKEVSRVLYSVSSQNITDIVSNANVANWKEIAAGITSFTNDPDDFNSKITELGDRILESKTVADSRDTAIRCYLAGNALDKIASIWLKELPALEAHLLESDNAENVSSPSEARLIALTNFVLKIAAYRSISNISGEISGPSAEPISKAIVEYTNLVAGNGEFELANIFLQLLPSDLAGTEKDRINKATGAVAAVTASKTVKSGTSAVANSVTAKTSKVSRGPYGRTTPVIPEVLSTPKPSYQATMPPIGAPLAPSAIPSASVPSSNPYVRASNPYAPHVSSTNIYKPAAPVVQAPPPAQATAVSPPPTGPPKPVYKQETDGWNDLPDTFKSKAPARRAAAVVTATPSPTPLPQTTVPPMSIPPGPKRSMSSGSAAPPPPKGSRANSKVAVPTIQSSPRPAPVHVNNRYAPPPSADVNAPSNTHSSPVGVSPSTKKNPYAVAPEVAPRVAYAPPPASLSGLGFSGGAAAPPAPPKNPYAPLASSVISPRVSNAGIVPPPMGRGIVSPPTSFGSMHAAPIQPAFSGVPPPPPAIGHQPAASAPPPPPAAKTPVPTKSKYPKGDRSHIPEKSVLIYQYLTKVLEAVKPNIPEKYTAHGEDLEKRLNILFDHLNNEDLLTDDAIEDLKEVCTALESKDIESASSLNTLFAANHIDQLGNWHRGITRLITMAEAMY